MIESTYEAPDTTADRDEPVNRTAWEDLVDRICANDPTGMEDLYAVFSRGIRFYLFRQLGVQEVEDKVHDIFLIVVQAIRRGDLRAPERLMGFVRTVVRRQVAGYIDQAIHARREHSDLESGAGIMDHRHDPEQKAISDERVDLMTQILQGISKRDQEILTRFYLLEQTQEEICAQMNLSETQFRLLKSRAKARFGELGRRKLERKKPENENPVRKSATA